MGAVPSDGSTLAEAGPFDAWSAGGRRLRAALLPLGWELQPGRVSRSGDLEAWVLAPDEVLLVRPADAAPRTGDPVAALRAAGALLTEVGAGLTHLRLAGPAAGSVLEAVCPVDLSERALAQDRLAQAPVGGIRAIVVREPGDGPPAYRLAVARDLAWSLWQVLTHAGASGTAR